MNPEQRLLVILKYLAVKLRFWRRSSPSPSPLQIRIMQIRITEIRKIRMVRSRQRRGDGSAYLCFVSILHGKFRAAVALPVYGLCVRFIGQGIDVHLVRYHKCGIKAQARLYSDHDIFYRELISNGCDAVTKLGKLDMMGAE